MYRDRPVAQTLPFVIPSTMGVWLRGKGEQTDMWEAAALYVDRILIWGAELMINKASFDSWYHTRHVLAWTGTAQTRRVDKVAGGLVMAVV